MSRFVFLVAIVLCAGCGSRTEVLQSDIPSVANFRRVTDAPAALQAAARAVVRVETRGAAAGTGSFVSADGLFVTNNHVLGFDTMPCAREGCYVNLHFDRQWGTAPKEPTLVFAEPHAASAELDVAVFQIWRDAEKKAKFVPPHHLQIRPVTTEDMVREGVVHMIGHPGGYLKMWTSGRVFSREGSWAHSSLPGLGGNSGSPYLDDQGRMIGIHHHGKESYAPRDVHFHAYGSSGASIAALVAGPESVERFHSVFARHSSDEIARSHFSYLFAHQGKATLADGTESPVPVELAKKCDQFIATSFRSVELLEAERHWCADLVYWLNCASPDDGRGYKFCPTTDTAAWRDRFDRYAEKIRAYHATGFLPTLFFASHLETTADGITRSQRERLAAYLARHRPAMSFGLASALLSAEGVTASHDGARAADYLRRYEARPHYELEMEDVIVGHELLHSLGALTREQFGDALRGMRGDGKLDIHNRLLLEETAYAHGLLQ